MRLSTEDDLGSALGSDQFNGKEIGSITALGYATFAEDGPSAADGIPTLELDVLSGRGFGASTLSFDPTNTVGALVEPGVWQTWDALGDDARWTVEEVPGAFEDRDLVSWGDVLDVFSEAQILGLVTLKSGKGESDVAGHVDAFRFNDLTFDFEPDEL